MNLSSPSTMPSGFPNSFYAPYCFSPNPQALVVPGLEYPNSPLSTSDRSQTAGFSPISAAQGLTYQHDSHSKNSWDMVDISTDTTGYNSGNQFSNHCNSNVIDPPIFDLIEDQCLTVFLPQQGIDTRAQKLLSKFDDDGLFVPSLFPAYDPLVFQDGESLCAFCNLVHGITCPFLSPNSFPVCNTGDLCQPAYTNQSNVNLYARYNHDLYTRKQQQQQQQQLYNVNNEHQLQHNHHASPHHHGYRNENTETRKPAINTNSIKASNKTKTPIKKKYNSGKKRDIQSPVLCDFPDCGKIISRRSNLKSHKEKHLNKKPFICEVCFFPFARLHDLKRHQYLHTGEKPYECRFCYKAFQRGVEVTKHCDKEIACRQARDKETQENGGIPVINRKKKIPSK
jgi:hypothetical protein